VHSRSVHVAIKIAIAPGRSLTESALVRLDHVIHATHQEFLKAIGACVKAETDKHPTIAKYDLELRMMLKTHEIKTYSLAHAQSWPDYLHILLSNSAWMIEGIARTRFALTACTRTHMHTQTWYFVCSAVQAYTNNTAPGTGAGFWCVRCDAFCCICSVWQIKEAGQKETGHLHIN
jgi:hypothetical protein